MILKEAFRYQNFLDNLLSQALRYLDDPEFTRKTTEAHLRSLADKDAQDELINVEYHGNVDGAPDQIVSFALYLLEQKTGLFKATSDAKRSIEMDIDSELASNIDRRSALQTLRRLCALKPAESIRKGTAYRINANGDQTPYIYEIVSNSVIDYDRAAVKQISNQLNERADAVSAAVDRILLDTNVDYEPPFPVNDSFDDALEQYLAK